MRTPQEHAITIAAGAFYDLCDYNRMVTFYDVTAGATLNWAVDDDPKQRAREGFGYELPQTETFKRIRLFNDGGASLTVIVSLSEGRVYDNRAQISEVLDSIDERLAGTSTTDDKDKTNVADGSIPAAATAVFAANADRKSVLVVAAESNAGYIYVGKTNAVTPTLSLIAVLLPAGSWDSNTWQGGVWACGSDGAQHVYASEED